MILLSDLRVMRVRLMELIMMLLMQDTAHVSHVRILIFVLQFTCNTSYSLALQYTKNIWSLAPWSAALAGVEISPWWVCCCDREAIDQVRRSDISPSHSHLDNQLTAISNIHRAQSQSCGLSTLAISQYISPLKQTQAALCQLNTNLHIYNFISVL